MTDETAALRHELAELRAEAVDLRRANAVLRRDLDKLKTLGEFESLDWVQELCAEVNILRLRSISSNDELVRLDREVALLREDRARLADLRKMAVRCLSFDRHARTPTDGMQTGDTLIVGEGDWFRLVRLAKFAVRWKVNE